MKKVNFKTYAFWILLAEGVGALSGWLSRGGMKAYESTIIQPPLSPPSWLFPIVWAILYALMGFGAARVYTAPKGPDRTKGLNLFILQLVVNFFWSLIFFNLEAYGFAFLWILILWVLIIGMIYIFNKTDRLAATLQIPYLIWVTFAAYLNLMVWLLNR